MALTVGTKAPSFSTKDDEGKTVSLSDFAGKTVVLYFYPKDDTPGCTKEAQNFRDNHTQYQDKDVVVLGVSQDDEASHKQFKQKYGLPFTLLTDVDGGGYAKRATYIIDGDGKISHVDTNVQASSHAEDLLSTVS